MALTAAPILGFAFGAGCVGVDVAVGVGAAASTVGTMSSSVADGGAAVFAAHPDSMSTSVTPDAILFMTR